MNRSRIIPIILLCNVSLVAFGQAASPSKPLTGQEPTLIALEKSFIEAARKGSSDFFKRTLATDFSYVGYDGELADRQQMIDERSEGGFDVTPYNMKVLSVGEGVGIVTYDVVLRVPPAEDQGPPPRYEHFSTVWVKGAPATPLGWLYDLETG